MTKFCRKCRKTKDITEFNLDKSKKGGRRPECNTCTKKRKKKWRKLNPDKIAAYGIKGKEKSTTDIRRFRNGKASAANRGLIWDLTLENWCAIVIGQVCHYCSGELPKTGCSLDRKDSKFGYLLWNVVPCCTVCNTLKGAHLTYEEMLVIMAMRKGCGIAVPGRSLQSSPFWYNH